MLKRSVKKLIFIYLITAYTIFAGIHMYEILCGSFDIRYVATSSMEPSFPRGSIIIIMRNPIDVAIGDPITYTYPQAPNHLLFHRVIDMSGDKIYVKGDTSSAIERIERKNVTGVCLFSIPYMGLLSEVFANDPLFTFLLFLLVTAILLHVS